MWQYQKGLFPICAALLSLMCAVYVIFNAHLNRIMGETAASFSQFKHYFEEPHAIEPECEDLWTAIQHGHWRPWTPGEEELKEVNEFLNETRVEKFNLPSSLQRTDGRCGGHYRYPTRNSQAMCNRYGTTPCCYDNVCVNKTMSECICNDDSTSKCFDSRAVIHADFAEFVMDDQNCKLKDTSTREKVALKNTDIIFMGDSLIFQFYNMALLIAIRGGRIEDAYAETETDENTKRICRCQRKALMPRLVKEFKSV